MLRDLLPILLALYPVLYVSTFVHELGHALLGWACGLTIGSFGLGLGRPFWVWNWRGTRIYFCRVRPLRGFTFVIFPRIYPGRFRVVGVLAGGVLAQAVLAATALVLWRSTTWGGSVWLLVVVVNALGIANLIPFRFRIGTVVYQTDGARILQTLRCGSLEMPAPELIQMTTALRPLWESVGDRVTLSVSLLLAAHAWLDLGDLEQADRLCAEAESFPLDRPRFIRAFAAWVRGQIACACGQREASASALAEAEQGFQALNHDIGLFLVELGGVELLLQQADATAVQGRLEALACQPLAVRQPRLQLALLEARLRVCALSSAEGEVERLQATYESCRGRLPSWARDRCLYRTLAGIYLHQENWTRAESAFRAALNAVARLDEKFTDAVEQERFRRAQATLLAEARACLQRSGKEEEARQLDQFFPSREELQRRDREAQEQRQGRICRTSLLLLAVNFGCVLIVAMAGLKGDITPMLSVPLASLSPRERVWFSFVLVFSCYLSLAAIAAAFYGAVGRWIGALRRQRGYFLLTLTISPWIVWMVLLVEEWWMARGR